MPGARPGFELLTSFPTPVGSAWSESAVLGAHAFAFEEPALPEVIADFEVVGAEVEVAANVRLALRLHRPVSGTPGVDLAPGEGKPPVLAVHGLASNSRLWDGVAELLAKAGHVVAAVDLRGHGRSDKPDSGYDFDSISADLLAVLAHLDWLALPERVIVAGQSWGANVAVEFAIGHPDVLAGVVLVDGGTIELSGRFADWPTCEAALAPPQLEGTPADRIESWIRQSHPDWPESGIAATLANLEVLPDGTVRPWLSRANHMSILKSLWDHHPSQRWSELAVPVLIISAEDPSGPGGRHESAKREEVSMAARSSKWTEAVWIAGDHDLHAQHPDLIAAEIMRMAAGEIPAGGADQ